MTETGDVIPTPDRETSWRAIMARWRQSGLSQQEFCEKEQSNAPRWDIGGEIKRRDGQDAPSLTLNERPSGQTTDSAPRKPAPLFVEVEIAPSQSAWACEIVLRDGLEAVSKLKK